MLIFLYFQMFCQKQSRVFGRLSLPRVRRPSLRVFLKLLLTWLKLWCLRQKEQSNSLYRKSRVRDHKSRSSLRLRSPPPRNSYSPKLRCLQNLKHSNRSLTAPQFSPLSPLNNPPAFRVQKTLSLQSLILLLLPVSSHSLLPLPLFPSYNLTSLTPSMAPSPCSSCPNSTRTPCSPASPRGRKERSPISRRSPPASLETTCRKVSTYYRSTRLRECGTLVCT